MTIANKSPSFSQRFVKRLLDILLSTVALSTVVWILLPAYIIASIDTRQHGAIMQTRIGRNGKPFKVIKIRTMRSSSLINTTVTALNDPRITWVGSFFRKTKIDELPQLINVLFGQMSFVGPRPDVPGFADMLVGNDRRILSVRPGITGPASLFFRKEEELLSSVENPEAYNKELYIVSTTQANTRGI